MIKYLVIILIIVISLAAQVQADSPFQYGYLLLNLFGWQVEMSFIIVLIAFCILLIPIFMILKAFNSTKALAAQISSNWQNSSSNKAAVAMIANNWELAATILGNDSDTNSLNFALAIDSHIKAGTLKSAMKLIEKHQKKSDDPESPTILMLKGQVLSKLERNTEAIHCIETILQNDKMPAEWLKVVLPLLIREQRWARIEKLMQNKKYKKIFSKEMTSQIHHQKQQLLTIN